MLQRGHSDFAWFKERTESLQSDSLTVYAEMASSTNGPTALNPEPADPQIRSEHNLPPKSYADSVSQSTQQNGGVDEPGALNAEPADPQERAEHNLLPKSYADSVVRSPPARNGAASGQVNGTVHHKLVNGDVKELDDGKLVYEKYTSQGGETSLTSVKVDEEHHQSLKHSEKTAPRDNKKVKKQDTPKELASGRKAGAGWEKSAYEHSPMSFPLREYYY